jgi:hypothetical protein
MVLMLLVVMILQRGNVYEYVTKLFLVNVLHLGVVLLMVEALLMVTPFLMV